jgi:hypothetical protein
VGLEPISGLQLPGQLAVASAEAAAFAAEFRLGGA